MNYCSLEDAFQEGAPSPGCGGDQATKQARREERRKARRCKGPAATYLDLDPDRQNLTPLPEVNAMNHVTGLREHVPVTAPQEEGFASELIHVQPASVPAASSKKKFFGADPDDGFADYEPDQKDTPSDFMAAFQPSGVAGPLPSPSMQQEWKPLTASGAQTAFIEHLPPPGGQYAASAPRVPRALRGGELSMEDIMKKMDRIMARLDDTHTASPEQVMSEMMMFISSGIFVLFLMDLLVKKGSTLRF
jgi:hypothetical protein